MSEKFDSVSDNWSRNLPELGVNDEFVAVLMNLDIRENASQMVPQNDCKMTAVATFGGYEIELVGSECGMWVMIETSTHNERLPFCCDWLGRKNPEQVCHGLNA